MSTNPSGKHRHRYQSLADELAIIIRSGRLPAGSVMPSLRDCATQQGLSLNTVIAAYRLLEDQGLISPRPQAGFFVCDVLPELQASLRSQPGYVMDELDADVMRQLLQAQQQPENLDLALACPLGDKFFPGERLAKTTAWVLRHQTQLIRRYALPPGSLLLREQIIRRAERLGMVLRAEDLVLTHGAIEGLQLALRAVTQHGDCVGIEAPSYFNLYPLMSSLGLKAIELPTHPQQGLDLDALEQLLAKQPLQALICMPTVHNPLGYVMPRAAKQRLAALICEHGIPLIEDLVYAELQFNEPPEPALKSFDHAGLVIVCGGFSKTLAPDYRIGWIDAGRFSHKVQQLKFASAGAESWLLSESVGQFLANGSYEHHLKTIRRLYEGQVTQMRGLIAQHFPPGTRASQPMGGFLLWVELPAGIDSTALFEAALAHGIVIMPGQVYSNGARYRHCIRLSCCQEIDERCMAAVKTLGILAHQLICGERND